MDYRKIERLDLLGSWILDFEFSLKKYLCSSQTHHKQDTTINEKLTVAIKYTAKAPYFGTVSQDFRLGFFYESTHLGTDQRVKIFLHMVASFQRNSRVCVYYSAIYRTLRYAA
jgi:hypothetical protein